MKRGPIFKKSQVGIITTVLLILLVLAGIVIIFNIVLPLIRNSSDEVNIDIFTTQLSINQ